MPLPRLSLAASAAFALLLIHACTRETGPTLSASDAFSQAQAGQLTLIDVRRPDEWRQTGVAPGALRISMIHPQGDAGFVRQVSAEVGGDRNAPIALLCRAGNRTRHVQTLLHEAGFTRVYNVAEGMSGSGSGPGWIPRGLPVEACPRC
jgi:rhodanese-related sulfurtransferase